jgi:hypothetical protein
MVGNFIWLYNFTDADNRAMNFYSSKKKANFPPLILLGIGIFFNAFSIKQQNNCPY